jgi:hypothetical protein
VLALGRGEPGFLFSREVHVGGLERREIRNHAAPQGTVRGRELIHHHHDRPEVGGDVVHHDEEHVLLGGASPQRDTQHRPSAQIKRAGRLGLQLGQQLLAREATRLMQCEGDGRCLMNLLNGLSFPLTVGGPQRRVPVNEQLPCTAEDFVIERTREPHREGDVVGRARGVELMQMPERLLARRQGGEPGKALGCSAQDVLQPLMRCEMCIQHRERVGAG